MSEKSAKIIKDFLRRHKITITEFADATDLCRPTIYKYLKGGKIQKKIARKLEQKILEEYGVFIPREKLLQ